MNWPYELQIGWRYTRSGRAGRRNGFISFISAVSMAGIALGVAALIIVLSVMNGFQKEVRDRMLAVIAHVEVRAPGDAALPDWRLTAAKARQHPQVIGAAPFVAAQALIAHGEQMRGTLVRGISPDDEASVTDLAARLRGTVLTRLQPGAWGVVLGGELARSLGVREGDKVALIAPGGQVTPAGVIPRLKQLTVVGTFDSGHYDYDAGLALMQLDDAARLFRVEGPTGVQLRLKDVHAARGVAEQLSKTLGKSVEVRDWTRSNRNWFDAVQIEKRLMFIILTLIVAVAAFNLVSTLVMTVTDKRADIAILRTLGASPRSVMGIFMVQGAASGDHRHAVRRAARHAGGRQHRRHRAGHRTCAGRELPARQHLPDQPHAQRPAAWRHRADRADLAAAVLHRHPVPELARQPRAAGAGAAL